MDLWDQRELRSKIENILGNARQSGWKQVSVTKMAELTEVDETTLDAFLTWHMKSPGTDNLIKSLVWLIAGETYQEKCLGFPPLRYIRAITGIQDYTYDTDKAQTDMRSYIASGLRDIDQWIMTEQFISERFDRFIEDTVKQ